LLKILASADIHAPRYENLFINSLEELAAEPDLVVLAGDLVDKNNVYALRNVYNLLSEKYGDKPVVAVYGNEEYRGFENKYRELYSKFMWLNDEYVILSVKGYKLGIIGTRGALDKPTTWQARNIPDIFKYYAELPARVSTLIDECRRLGTHSIILVSHYGVTYKNLKGEPESIWPHLACSRFEEVIVKKRVDLVIHGHAHNGLSEVVYINSTPVYNVSLPGRGRVVLVECKPRETVSRIGLDKWLSRS